MLQCRIIILLTVLLMSVKSKAVHTMPPHIRAKEEHLLASLNSPERIITLSQAVDIACSNNPLMQIAEARIRMARADAWRALSYYFPRGKLGATYTHYGEMTLQDVTFDVSDYSATFNSFITDYNSAIRTLRSMAKQIPDNPGPFLEPVKRELSKLRETDVTFDDTIETRVIVEERDEFVGTLRIVQPLFLGGRVFFKHTQAKRGEEIAYNRSLKAQQNVMHDTVATYFLYIHAKNMYSILHEAHERVYVLERMADRRRETADPTKPEDVKIPIDYWRARTLRLALSNRVTEAAQACDDAQRALHALMGFSPYVTCQPVIFPLVSTTNAAHCIDTALSTRPAQNLDVAHMELAVDALGAGRRSIRGEFLPQVYGFFQYDTPVNWQYGSRGDGNWFVGVGFEIPVFDLFENITKYRKARAEEDAAKAVLMGTLLKTENQLAHLATSRTSLAQRRQTLEESLAAMDKRMDVARDLYSYGQVSLKEILDAQQEDTFLQIEYAQLIHKEALTILDLAEFFPRAFDEYIGELP